MFKFINNYLDKKLHKFGIFMLNLVFLYLLVLAIVLGLFKLMVSFDLLSINIVMMLVVTIGLVFDKRFTRKSLIFLFVLIIVQLLIYKYLEIVPISLLKDMFWFSLALIISFVWHICILQGIFKVAEYLKIEYLEYLTSRLSLVTSMTWIIGILNGIDMILENVLVFYLTKYEYELEEKMKKEDEDYLKSSSFNFTLYEMRKSTYYKTNKKIKNLNVIRTFKLMLIEILRNIALYFMRVFYSYSSVLMGKSRISKEMLKKNAFRIVVFFLGTLLLSLVIGTPRLYIVWLIVGTKEIRRIAKKFQELYNERGGNFIKKEEIKKLSRFGKFSKFLREECSHSEVSDFVMGKRQIGYYELFNYEGYGEHYILATNPMNFKNFTWFYGNYHRPASGIHLAGNTIRVFELCDLFIYKKDMNKRIVANGFVRLTEQSGRYDDIIVEFIDNYKEQVGDIGDIEEYGDWAYSNYNDKGYGIGGFCKYRDYEKTGLFEFLFGEYGNIVLRNKEEIESLERNKMKDYENL